MTSSLTKLATSLALAALLGGCTSAPAQGTERGACYPNNSCNAGLSCLSGLCVSAGSDGGAMEASSPDATASDTAAPDATQGPETGGPDVGPTPDASPPDAPSTPDASPPDAPTADAAPDVQRIDDGGIPCPGAVIFHPGTETRAVNTSVPFVGRGRGPACEVLTGSALQWRDSLEGAIGTGEMFNHTFTMVGSHTVTLTATYTGGTATATLTFTIM